MTQTNRASAVVPLLPDDPDEPELVPLVPLLPDDPDEPELVPLVPEEPEEPDELPLSSRVPVADATYMSTLADFAPSDPSSVAQPSQPPPSVYGSENSAACAR